MNKKIILSLFIFSVSVYAKVLTTPVDAMHYCYGENIKVSKKNILLKKTEAKNIMQKAKVKLKSKIFRVFKATKNEKILGYGILINRKVRSKNAVVLYMIDTNSTLKAIEIIAFNEPTEYLASKKWQEQFKNISTSKELKLSKNISTITGATMTAQTITDGSRLASTFYNEILK